MRKDGGTKRSRARVLGGHAADPDALGGWFTQVDAGGTTANGYRHGLVILALVDAEAGAWTKLETFHELKKLGIFFEDAENFVGTGDLSVRQPHSSEFAPQLGHAAEEWDAVRAADVAAKPLEQQRRDLRRNAVFQALGFLVRSGPINADDVGKKFFGQAMAKNQMLGDSRALFRKDDAAVSADVQVTGPGHALERGGNSGRRDTKIFGQASANRRLLFLHELPDSLQIIFLGNAGLFAAQDASQ